MKNSSRAISTSTARRWTRAPERVRWVKAWERSQETQAQFARAHGLCVSTLRNWIRQHGEDSPQPGKGLELHEVDLGKLLGPELASRSSGWETEIRLPNGATLCVARETPVNRVRELVEALRC